MEESRSALLVPWAVAGERGDGFKNYSGGKSSRARHLFGYRDEGEKDFRAGKLAYLEYLIYKGSGRE